MKHKLEGILITAIGASMWGFGAVAGKQGEGLFDIWRDKKYIPRLLIVAIFAFAECQTTYFAAVDLSNISFNRYYRHYFDSNRSINIIFLSK